MPAITFATLMLLTLLMMPRHATPRFAAMLFDELRLRDDIASRRLPAAFTVIAYAFQHLFLPAAVAAAAMLLCHTPCLLLLPPRLMLPHTLRADAYYAAFRAATLLLIVAFAAATRRLPSRHAYVDYMILLPLLRRAMPLFLRYGA